MIERHKYKLKQPSYTMIRQSTAFDIKTNEKNSYCILISVHLNQFQF